MNIFFAEISRKDVLPNSIKTFVPPWLMKGAKDVGTEVKRGTENLYEGAKKFSNILGRKKEASAIRRI